MQSSQVRSRLKAQLTKLSVKNWVLLMTAAAYFAATSPGAETENPVREAPDYFATFLRRSAAPRPACFAAHRTALQQRWRRSPSELHSRGMQLCSQLRGVLAMNGLHAATACALHIERTVIDKEAFFGSALGEL